MNILLQTCVMMAILHLSLCESLEVAGHLFHTPTEAYAGQRHWKALRVRRWCYLCCWCAVRLQEVDSSLRFANLSCQNHAQTILNISQHSQQLIRKRQEELHSESWTFSSLSPAEGDRRKESNLPRTHLARKWEIPNAISVMFDELSFLVWWFLDDFWMFLDGAPRGVCRYALNQKPSSGLLLRHRRACELGSRQDQF